MSMLNFELTEQAERLIEEYDLDEKKVKVWKLAKSEQIGGKDVRDFMVEKADGQLEELFKGE